jgi:hypothetical protein
MFNMVEEYDQRMSQMVEANAVNNANYTDNLRTLTNMINRSVLDQSRTLEGMNSHYSFIGGATLALIDSKQRGTASSSSIIFSPESNVGQELLSFPGGGHRPQSPFTPLLFQDTAASGGTVSTQLQRIGQQSSIVAPVALGAAAATSSGDMNPEEMGRLIATAHPDVFQQLKVLINSTKPIIATTNPK